MDSREKGKRGELEVINLYFNGNAYRGIQSRSGSEVADIICEDLPQFHFEVKRRERGNVLNWITKAQEDALEGTLPVIIHRRSRTPWLITMFADDFFKEVLKYG